MCELLALSSLLPARLSFSLGALAARSAAPGTSRDGWGVAYYQGRDVALFREPVAASDSALVHHLESQGPPTTLAISHIRHATRGEVSLANTQPFLRELGGVVHVFAHNGDLPGIAGSALQPGGQARPVGTTDSEHAFCALLARLQQACGPAPQQAPLARRLDVVAAFAADLRALGPANFFYADGEVLFAHGHRRWQAATGRIAAPGLHLITRRCAPGQPGLQAHGVTVSGALPGHAPGDAPDPVQQVVLVASVPLSAEGWRPLAEGEVVALRDGQLVDARRP